MSRYYLVFIIAAADQFFALLPLMAHHARNVGIVTIMLGLSYLLLRAYNRSLDLKILQNPFTWLFVIYLVFVTSQVSVAAFNYGQSIPDGIIGVREQFYYLSFFLYLFLLDDIAKIKKFLDLLSVVAIILIVLGLINYFGPTIFYHIKAEGHGVRSGIVRAFIPSMNVLAVALLWQSSKWISATDSGESKGGGLLALIFMGAHFFRQTRSRVISVVLVLTWLLVSKRRYKLLAAAVLVGATAVSVAQVSMEENIFTNVFTSSAEEITHQSGNVAPRMRLLDATIEVFKEHPIMGSGVVALRIGREELKAQWHELTLTDLGYANWLKAYGLVGMTWLVVFFYSMWSLARRAERRVSREYLSVALFSRSYLYFVLISFLTLNHLMATEGIALITLCAAIIVRTLAYERSDERLADNP